MAGTKANVVLSPIGLFIIPIRRLHLICHTHVASKNQWLTPTIFKMNYYLKKGGSSDNDPFRCISYISQHIVIYTHRTAAGYSTLFITLKPAPTITQKLELCPSSTKAA